MLLTSRLRALAAVVALTCAAVPHTALAEEGLSDPLAREFKQAGDAAMQSLRYEDALTAYEKAGAIEPHASLMFNRARALQALQRYPEALALFETFRTQASEELLARAGKLDELIERLRLQVSTLRVVCDVPGATVLVRGHSVGETPLSEPLRVNSGPAKLSVTADGYLPYEEQLVLEGAREASVEVRLIPKRDQGRLRIRAAVPGAIVYVDGARLGAAPAEVSLSRGRHRVRVEHPDYRVADTTVEVLRGESRAIDVALEKRPGILQKWWFWTGAAVVAAAGIGVTVALLTERKPERGDIAPGVVSGPLLRF